MDVLVGPTFSIDVKSSPPYAGDPPTGNVFYAGDSSESDSSIGTPDDSDDQNDTVSPKRNRAEDEEEEEEEEEEEFQSKLNGLNSLDSLEDSLPIKKGLSNHFIGKSKSFTDLSQVSTVKELQKQENPLNKRRRVLIASKWSRKSSFYTWSNPQSMPLLPVDEDEDNENEAYKEATTKVSPSSSSSSSIEEKKNPQEQLLMRQHNRVPHSYAAHMRLRLGSFKSRSFSLADLQEHDEVEDEDEDNDEQHLG